MAQRLIALEWDRVEARFVVARLAPGKVAIETAGHVIWGEGIDGPPGDAGAKIAAALAQAKASRLDALVLVNRLQAEVKPLELPPAPDADLPHMVRFAALKDLTTNNEDAPLDFVPRPGPAELPREVLAASLEPAVFLQYKQICQDAGIKLLRMGLRPCSGAALALRREVDKHPAAVLVVELLPAQFDASLVLEGQTALVRTARIDAAKLALDAGSYPRLVAEVRRTLAACGPRLAGKRVEVIHLVGGAENLQRFARHLGEELDLPVDVVSAWNASDISVDRATIDPVDDGRFGALVGALLDEASSVRPAIDFLNPRKPPPPPNTLRPRILMGTAAALVVAAGVWWVYSGLAQLDAEIAELKRDSLALDKSVAAAKDVKERADLVAKWADGEVLWLSELKRLSQNAPDNKELVLTQLILTTGAKGGDARLEGVLRDSAVVGPMINKLRDERHEVSSQGGQDLRGSKSTASGPMGQYGWRFQALMAVAPGIEEAEAAAPAAGKAPAVPVKTPATPEKTAPAATGQTAGR